MRGRPGWLNPASNGGGRFPISSPRGRETISQAAFLPPGGFLAWDTAVNVVSGAASLRRFPARRSRLALFLPGRGPAGLGSSAPCRRHRPSAGALRPRCPRRSLRIAILSDHIPILSHSFRSEATGLLRHKMASNARLVFAAAVAPSRSPSTGRHFDQIKSSPRRLRGRSPGWRAAATPALPVGFEKSRRNEESRGGAGPAPAFVFSGYLHPCFLSCPFWLPTRASLNRSHFALCAAVFSGIRCKTS